MSEACIQLGEARWTAHCPYFGNLLFVGQPKPIQLEVKETDTDEILSSELTRYIQHYIQDSLKTLIQSDPAIADLIPRGKLTLYHENKVGQLVLHDRDGNGLYESISFQETYRKSAHENGTMLVFALGETLKTCSGSPLSGEQRALITSALELAIQQSLQDS